MEHLIPRGSTRYLPWTDLNIFYKFFKTVIKNQNSNVPIVKTDTLQWDFY